MKRRRSKRRARSRHGNFAMLFGLGLFVVMGFAALAIDISWMRMAQGQAQDVADAASQAAMNVLRRTGDQAAAAQAAQVVIDKNSVGGGTGTLHELSFGAWDPSVQTFTAGATEPNAVRATVTRTGSNAMTHLLGQVFGHYTFDVAASSTSATRNLHAIVVLDITNSWHPTDYVYARDASLEFLDTVRTAPGPYDKLGMTVFTNRYGWEFTPFTSLRDTAAMDAVRADWVDLKTASKAGDGSNWPDKCDLDGSNDFDGTGGGCYPNMPREYTDEPGTDHTTGMEMAATMFEEQPDPNAFRAMIVLTDGKPNGIASGSGDLRAAEGYVEPWRQYTGPAPHSRTDIEWDSEQLTADLWTTQRVHTWVVSFVADATFMHNMPRGQGYYALTDDPNALIPIFEDIANSLPLAIVE